MRSDALSPDEYIESLPDDRKDAMAKLRRVINKKLPGGFKEVMGYGMLGWVVPLNTYPAGYHCTPGEPLPFLGLASQKNFIAVYHMGIYGDLKLLEWFRSEWPKFSKKKLDMGKSCIRFKKPEDIPFDLIGDLVSKMSPIQWIERYESAMKRRSG